MDYSNIKFEIDGPIGLITIDRPKVLNALNDETIAELDHCFTSIGDNDSVRCVILTGTGEKSFVAGADIGELALCDVVSGQAKCDRGQVLMNKIENLRQPVICAVNGFALGGGCEIAMACDIRLASENAMIGQPEVNLGIIPGYGGTQRLARLVGPGKAKQMIFTGDFINAAEAHRIGLVDEVYPLEELLDKTKKMAGKIASKGPLAIKAAKEAINLGMDVDLKSGCAHEAVLFAAICASEDKAEGTKAFLEKRKADFKGK
ncbi:MAG: crotonase [candidate division Zixibacteria bacterium]|nr:crotonase [candidate division Zixibacteria bacterium]